MTLRTALLTLTLLLPAAAGRADTIFQIANDAATTSSFVNGTNFSPAGAPTADNDYVNTQYQLRTPETATSYTFGGASLTLGNGTSAGALFYKGTDHSTITINNLIANNGYIYQLSNNDGKIMTLDGAITVQAGGLSIRPQADNRSRYIIVTASISGTGAVTVVNPSGASNTSASARLSHSSNTYQGGTTIGDELSSTTTDRINLSVSPEAELGSGGVVRVMANGSLNLEGAGNLGPGHTLLLDDDLAGLARIGLNFDGTMSIAALSFDGGATFALPGTYGAPGSGAEYTSGFFSGTGMIAVVPEPGMMGVLAAAGLLIRRRRSR